VADGNQPGRQVCPLCASDDDVTSEVDSDGHWYLVCNSKSSGHPFRWTPERHSVDASGHEGIAEEWGIYDDLLATFEHKQEFVEHGIVEYRYALANPTVYQLLVDRYSHRTLRPTQYTVSVFIGGILSRLQRDGLLLESSCSATGFWKGQGVRAWALADCSPGAPVVTWYEFASALGIDSESWPIPLIRK
jgi:hypothetical protein